MSARPTRRLGTQLGRRRFAAACASLAALCAAEPAASAPPRLVVHGVQDHGLETAIVRAVGEERGPPGNRLEARRRARDAAENATALLVSEGYYDADVRPDIGEGDHPALVLDIDIGPRTLVQSATLSWTGEAPSAAAQAAAEKALKLPPGTPGRAADVLAAEGRAVAALAEQGYADAAAPSRKVIVDHADHSMRATFNLAAGAPVRLGGLEIKTRGRTDPRWVRKLTPWKVGEVYRPDKVAELERRLTDTQVYDTVAVALAPEPAADGLRPVVVSLADRQPHVFDLSAGYSTSEGADFDVRYSLFNELRRGDTLTLEARLAELDSRYGPQLVLPHFLSPGQTLTTSLYYIRTVTDAYTEEGEQLSADLTQRYGKTSYLTRGISITNSRVDDKELGPENLTALRLIGAFYLDQSDNALDPRRGWKADARVVPTLATGDANLAYVRMTAQASSYFSLDTPGDNLIATRVRLGSIVGGGIPGVPAEDRFFAGGGGSVRGYEYQGVGPHYADNTPKGGLSLFEASLEFRHRFGTSPFGGVLFVDAGSVGENAYPDLHQIATAVGIGFRYNLGFAPIRADFAVPLQHQSDASQQPFQIYLSIGQSF